MGRALRSCLSAVALAALVGCSGEIIRRDPLPGPCVVSAEGCFTEPEDPPKGLARVYVFRPDLSDELTREEPTFRIMNVGHMPLPWQSFAVFDLPMGTYKFEVDPAKRASEVWDMQGELAIRSPGRYYLAIWNGGTPASDASNPVAAALGVQNSALGMIATILSGPRGSPRYAGHEIVKEQDALDTLRRCKRAYPILEWPATQPPR